MSAPSLTAGGAAEAERSGVDSTSVLGKVSSIMEAFDSGSPVLRLSQLSERTGLPRSTVHRTVEQLRELGWLERRAGGYRLGSSLFELGCLVTRHHDLREAALPYLADLYELTHQVVHLALYDGGDAVYLEKLGGHRSVAVSTRVGDRTPAYASATGRAMLAFADEVPRHVSSGRGERRRRLPAELDREALRAELARIRADGVAVDRGEPRSGCTSVAAPVRGSGRAVAAISVTGPAGAIDVDSLVPAVRAAAAGAWRSLFSGRRSP